MLLLFAVRCLHEIGNTCIAGGGRALVLTSQGVGEFLLAKADMLRDYFSIDIDPSANLTLLPQLAEGPPPRLADVAMLLLDLTTEVVWDREVDCFNTIGQQLAIFGGGVEVEEAMEEDSTQKGGALDLEEAPGEVHVSLDEEPKKRSRTEANRRGGGVCKPNSSEGWLRRARGLLAPEGWGGDGTIVRLACTEQLYRTFERC